MSERVHHCPFLNRSDPRCSTHFSLDSLSDAFADCLGAYAACPTYRELLAERRTRRGEAVEPAGRERFPGEPAIARPGAYGTPFPSHGSPLVPITLTATAGHRQAPGRPLA